jgi:uncharacterized sporulation protein YeaH/YhbH (DUF444 family)
MAHIIIDRRKNDKGKSTDNRRRFVRRVKQQVREAVKDTIRDGSIKDIIDEKGKKVKIPGKGLNQPHFQHDASGGMSDRVYPGNKEFTQGDRINRPQGGGGGGGKEGSPDGEGEDEFAFHLTRDEFLDLFFEDLELPDLVKKDIAKVDEFQHRRAGFSVDGNPSRLNIVRSMKQSKGRRLGLRSPKKKKLKSLEEQLEAMMLDGVQDEKKIAELKEQIAILKRKIKAIPFIDDMDLRYNRWEKVPVPTTQAVMFGIMDVSASMGEWEKEMAKRFFMLLLLFLTRNYERVDIIWIRHHTRAVEVEEDEFFHSRETGGTIVSSALKMMHEIIKERYPTNQWNIFGCQISDGDNWPEDNLEATETMRNYLLPLSQFFAYVEVDRHGGSDSDLWPHYAGLQDNFKNFVMSIVSDVTEIYPIFRGLFEKRD